MISWQQEFRGRTVLTIALLVILPTAVIAQTRVSLAEGRASVVFPLGSPERMELSPSDIEYLRERATQGEAIDPLVDAYEAEVSGQWFVASATDFHGAGAPPPPTKCLAAPPAQGSKHVSDWSCREFRRGAAPAMEVRYINPMGELVRVRSYFLDRRLYVLIHSRVDGERRATGTRDLADAFFASFRLATP